MLIPETQTEKQLLVLLICIPAMLRVSAKESAYAVSQLQTGHENLCSLIFVPQSHSFTEFLQLNSLCYDLFHGSTYEDQNRNIKFSIYKLLMHTRTTILGPQYFEWIRIF